MPEVRISDQPVCDFCSSAEPVWLFPCRNYEMQDLVPNYGQLPPQVSTGGWLACEECSRYAMREDWGGLARRVTLNGGINDSIRKTIIATSEDWLVRSLKRMWKQFAAQRVGAPVAWKGSK